MKIQTISLEGGCSRWWNYRMQNFMCFSKFAKVRASTWFLLQVNSTWKFVYY